MVSRTISAFIRDEDGASLVEGVIVINVIVVTMAVFIEFGVAVNQWNMAAKATQIGARVASISHPVDSDLLLFTGLEGGGQPGDPMPVFTSTCVGSTTTCTGTYPGAGLGGSYDAAAMDRIVFGQDGVCSLPAVGFAGMCDIITFPPITKDNITVTYAFGGLGYAGRPAGPVPVISVTLHDVNFNFLLLGRLLGLNQLTIPPFTVTAVGEDLSTTYP